MLIIWSSTSRDETAIGQLKIGVLLHDVILYSLLSSSLFLFHLEFGGQFCDHFDVIN